MSGRLLVSVFEREDDVVQATTAARKEGLEIVPVAHVDEVLRHALVALPEAIEWTEADDLASQPPPPSPDSPQPPVAH